jgi:hypothetical protein
MPSLKAIQKVIPSAETMVGRVVAYHEGKHVDLGEFVGDDAVALSRAGQELVAAASAPKAKKGKEVTKDEPKDEPPKDLADELGATLDLGSK